MALRLVIVALLVSACGDDATPMADAGRADSMVVIRCGASDDPDGDYIGRTDEGEADFDGDGAANWDDADADADTHLDVDEAGDADCLSPPFDIDGDTMPDFLDPDGNGDGISDSEQNGDTDGDSRPDWQDFDIDGDGLDNGIEFGTGATAVDTDGDGTADVLDTDSDGDTILDAHEGDRDPDRDMVPAFRDLDSDGDGIDDAVEAGDADPLTPPFQCTAEINPVSRLVENDGIVDSLDVDSDNDGVTDRDEVGAGSGVCDIDSDDDGFDDIVEVAYAQVNCPDGSSGSGCGCVTDASCGIPADDYFLVLPYLGEPEDRELDFSTSIRVADVFFLTDTTGSMGGTLGNVKATVTTPGTGLVDRIQEAIPDIWIGGGQHDDAPVSPYGSASTGDLLFAVAIGSTDGSTAEGRTMVQTAFNSIMLHFGGDGPESGTPALYEIVTGMGGMWTGPGAMFTVPNYAGDCLDTGWGAPCFRTAALPIIVHFTDICQHNGPPGEDPTCDPYVGITPELPTWDEAVAEMNRVGAKFVGINVTGTSCTTVVGPSGFLPCYFLKRTAEETGSVDLDGSPLVYDLPNASSMTVFADTVVGAISTLATRVPLDVTTAVRDDASDPYTVDATDFIKRRRPSCTGVAGDDACWVEPPGVSHDQAVAAIDTSTFFGVIPGTRVNFDITFQNDFHMGGEEIRIFIAYIDVTAGGSAVLDTRGVYIIVPPYSLPIE
jgi:hypothetical protein